MDVPANAIIISFGTDRVFSLNAIDLADAMARLSELVDRVQAGEVIDILQHGQPVARLVAARTPRQRIDVDQLRALTDTMPLQTEAVDVVRSMRDTDRY